MRSSDGRVLILVENLSVPFDRRVWQEALALRDAGWDVSVICPQGRRRDREPEQTLNGIRILRYPLQAASAGILSYVGEYPAALLRTVRLCLRVGRVDVVHACNPPDFFFPIGLVYKFFGAKFVFDQHDLVPELYLSRFGRSRDIGYWVMRLFEYLTYRTANMVIATNNSYRSAAISRGRRSPDHVVVVRSAPDIARFGGGEAAGRSDPEAPLHFCYLGVMGPQDGVDQALHALKILKDRGTGPEWTATFVGSGDCFDELVAVNGQLGLDDRVVFTGRVSDEELVRILRSADICLSPDPLNPLNDVSTMNKVMEYMAVAKPIVSYDLKEARYSAGDAAIYADEHTVESFADAVETLTKDPERRAAMGRKGYERLRNVLSWDQSRAELTQAYERFRPTGDRGRPS